MKRHLDFLATWLAGADAATESDSEFNGLLSYASESHAAIIGFGVVLALGEPGLVLIVATALGLASWKKISNRKALRELQREPWYGIGAGVLGLLARWWGCHGPACGLVQFWPF